MTVRGSGMAWVIVQPSAFMEIRFRRRAGFDAAAGKAAVVGSGEARVSYISYRDVAKVVLGVVPIDSDVTRTNLPLGGPDPASALDVVRAFEEDTGRRFHVAHVPVMAVRGMGFLGRPFLPAVSSLLGIAAHMAIHGDVIEQTETVRRLLPYPKTFRDFVREETQSSFTERVRVLLGGAGGTRA